MNRSIVKTLGWLAVAAPFSLGGNALAQSVQPGGGAQQGAQPEAQPGGAAQPGEGARPEGGMDTGSAQPGHRMQEGAQPEGTGQQPGAQPGSGVDPIWWTVVLRDQMHPC